MEQRAPIPGPLGKSRLPASRLVGQERRQPGSRAASAARGVRGGGTHRALPPAAALIARGTRRLLGLGIAHRDAAELQHGLGEAPHQEDRREDDDDRAPDRRPWKVSGEARWKAVEDRRRGSVEGRGRFEQEYARDDVLALVAKGACALRADDLLRCGELDGESERDGAAQPREPDDGLLVEPGTRRWDAPHERLSRSRGASAAASAARPQQLGLSSRFSGRLSGRRQLPRAHLIFRSAERQQFASIAIGKTEQARESRQRLSVSTMKAGSISSFVVSTHGGSMRVWFELCSGLARAAEGARGREFRSSQKPSEAGGSTPEAIGSNRKQSRSNRKQSEAIGSHWKPSEAISHRILPTK